MNHVRAVSFSFFFARKALRRAPLSAALALGLFFAPTLAQGQTHAGTSNPQTLERLLNARPADQVIRLSPVREAALESSALAIGTQTGLIEHAKEIAKAIDARRVQMEKAYRFGDLVIGQGVLPPVLVHTENAASVTDDTMRLAGAIYQIKQPARFFSGAPSWRDWLLMGMPVEQDMPQMPTNEQLLPRDEKERAFWQQKIKEAYASGREQAREIFEHNLAMLEQTYMGMRTFYDLYQRNMVSAPIIAKSQEIVTQDDPNTIVVGDTLFRITMPAQFQTNPEAWRALQAKPSTKPLLPVGHGFDPEQVRHAFAVFQEQKAKALAEQEAKKGFLGLPVVKKEGKTKSAQANNRIGAKPAAAKKPAPAAAKTQAVVTPAPAKVEHIRVGPTEPVISASSEPAGIQASVAAQPAKTPSAGGATTSEPIGTSSQSGVHIISIKKPLFSIPSSAR